MVCPDVFRKAAISRAVVIAGVAVRGAVDDAVAWPARMTVYVERRDGERYLLPAAVAGRYAEAGHPGQLTGLCGCSCPAG